MIDAPLIEVRCGDLHREKYRCQVRSDDLLKRGEGCLADGCSAGDASVGEYDIELGEPLYRHRNGAFDGFDVRHVRLDGQYLASKFCNGRVQRLPVPPGDRNARPLCQEKPCGSKANATIAARD
jgi:hypothetical protein